MIDCPEFSAGNMAGTFDHNNRHSHLIRTPSEGHIHCDNHRARISAWFLYRIFSNKIRKIGQDSLKEAVDARKMAKTSPKQAQDDPK